MVPTCRAACPFDHGLTGNTALCPAHVHSPASASRPQPLGNGYVGPPGSLVPSRSAVLPTRVPSWLWRHEDALPCPSLPPGSQGTPCSAGAGTIQLAVHGLAHTGSGGAVKDISPTEASQLVPVSSGPHQGICPPASGGPEGHTEAQAAGGSLAFPALGPVSKWLGHCSLTQAPS